MSSKSFSINISNSSNGSLNSSVQLPENLNKLLEDKDSNGIPDIAQDVLKNPSKIKTLIEDKDNSGIPDWADTLLDEVGNLKHTEIIINGQKYTDWSQVPAEYKNFHFNPYIKPKNANSTPQFPLSSPASASTHQTPKPSKSASQLFDTKTIIVVILLIAISLLLFL